MRIVPIETEKTFEDIDQLLDAIKTESTCGLGNSSRAEGRSNSWDHGLGFDGSMKMIRSGWESGAEQIKKLVDQVSEILKPESMKMDFVHDVAGGIPDIGRSIVGLPDSMIRFSPPEFPTKPIKIVVNCTASAGISADTLFNRGAAVGAVIDVLELRGYRCELWIVASTKGHSARGSMAVSTKIKDSNQPLDLTSLSFCLAHPAFFRRLMFAAWETWDRDTRQKHGITSSSGYGSCVDAEIEGTDLYFECAHLNDRSRFSSPEKCAEWVKETLINNGYVENEDFGSDW